MLGPIKTCLIIGCCGDLQKHELESLVLTFTELNATGMHWQLNLNPYKINNTPSR